MITYNQDEKLVIRPRFKRQLSGLTKRILLKRSEVLAFNMIRTSSRFYLDHHHHIHQYHHHRHHHHHHHQNPRHLHHHTISIIITIIITIIISIIIIIIIKILVIKTSKSKALATIIASILYQNCMILYTKRFKQCWN